MVVFQNPDDRQLFLDWNLIEVDRTLRVTGSGVDLQEFSAEPMPESGELIFLMVSRMLWDKGVGVFAEAARCLRVEHVGVRFQILGPIDQASKTGITLKEIQEWVDDGVLEYLGEAFDVRPFLAKADCIVLPSWYREGMPRVLLEAAAIGRPAITTDMPGCRDAVDDGVTGFLCAPGDVASLVAAMKAFIGISSVRRRAMGANARQRAEREFGEGRVVEAYLSFVR